MKRMSPEERDRIIITNVNKLSHTWLCKHGKWNRDKLLRELEQKLRTMRLNNG